MRDKKLIQEILKAYSTGNNTWKQKSMDKRLNISSRKKFGDNPKTLRIFSRFFQINASLPFRFVKIKRCLLVLLSRNYQKNPLCSQKENNRQQCWKII
jgi:hypothetical protein